MIQPLNTPNIINTIRPTLETFIGNDQAKTLIKNSIEVSLKKATAFPHTIITGISGGGKTTISYIIAESMNVPIIELNCATPNPNVLNQLLKVPDRGILFLDEVHALDEGTIESILYRFMDQGIVYLRFGDGRIEPFEIGKRITIMAATNMIDKLTTPFINRFELNIKLKPYTHEEMSKILAIHLRHNNVEQEALDILASATRYVPRHAVQFAKNIRDYAILHDLKTVTADDMREALHNLGIDEFGLTDDDRQYIYALYHTMNNMPTGINTLMGLLNDSRRNIETLEVYLIQEGIITRSGKGRQLTGKGMRIAMQLEQLN
jgi:Holliday junction DNA helicase RuvB